MDHQLAGVTVTEFRQALRDADYIRRVISPCCAVGDEFLWGHHVGCVRFDEQPVLWD